MNRPESNFGAPWNSDDDNPGFEGFARDHDTEDDVTASFGYNEADPIEEEIYKSPILIEEIAAEVRNGLSAYGWTGVEAIDGQKLLDICERLGIAPESKRALVALEDIGFSIEKENYKARIMDQAPTLEEIERVGESIEGIVEFQTEASLAAYAYLRAGMGDDPIINLPFLKADRDLVVSDIEQTRRIEPETEGEVNQKVAKISELNQQLKNIEEILNTLLSIEEVTERRERAFRRMHWLVSQDFLAGPLKEFISECRKTGIRPDFDLLASTIAGRYTDEAVVAKIEKKESEQSSGAAPADEAKPETPTDSKATQETEYAAGTVNNVETTLQRKYMPGIVDKLLEKHMADMVEQTGDKTEGEKRRQVTMLRRLQQAQALCRTVFQNDITDRVYIGSPISPLEYEMLELVRRRLYVHGEIEVLDEFIPFLPGSQLRKVKDKDLDQTPLLKFSGRSKQDLVQEIDLIIAEHPELESDYIAHLVEGGNMDFMPHVMRVDLTINALKILEKLAFKENYSVRRLISTD